MSSLFEPLLCAGGEPRFVPFGGPEKVPAVEAEAAFGADQPGLADSAEAGNAAPVPAVSEVVEVGPAQTAEDEGVEAQVAAAFEQGRAEGALSVQPALEVLAKLHESLTELQRDYLGAQRESVVALSIAVASSLLSRELRAPDQLVEQVERALDRLAPTEAVEIEVSATDGEVILAHSEEWATVHGKPGLVINEGLAAGEFVLRSGVRELSARREEVLSEVRESLSEIAKFSPREAAE